MKSWSLLLCGLSWATAASAADTPSIWGRAFAAAAFNPTGVVVDGASELRAPILRYGGVAFNDTFVGGGARVTLTPVHLDTAVRLSVQPIDLLPITVELVRTTYWESPWGLVPIDRIDDVDTKGRADLYDADRDFAGGSWSLIVSPTLQVRAGPVVAFSNPTFTWMWLRPEKGPEPWVFEPYRGLVMGYEDLLLEHTSALLWEARDGEDAPVVRVGAVLRGKLSTQTKDNALTTGAIVQWRPGHKPNAPTFLMLVTPYVRDPDYEGLIPYVALAMTVEWERALAQK